MKQGLSLSGKAALVTGVLALALVLGTGNAVAAPVACGDVVTTNTTLDNDLLNCPGDGLVIGAHGITIDLNRHVIDGNGPSSGRTGINNRGGFDGVKIEDGRISDFYEAIRLEGATRNAIRQLRTSGGSIWVQHSPNNLIERNFISLAGGGVVLIGDSDNNRLRGNSITKTGNGVFLLPGFENAVYVPDDNVIEGNRLFGNDYGVTQFGARSRIAGNAVYDNEYGLYLVGPNGVVERNLVVRNEIGILLANNGNALISRNWVEDSEEDGISLGRFVTGVTVARNFVRRSGDDGIDSDGGSPSVVLTRNRSDDNTDLGIEAEPGVTDGGGNKASGNGNPAQCTNVVCS